MRELTTNNKTCTKCQNSKPATTDYFQTDKTTRDKLSSWCRTCHYQAIQKHRRTTPQGFLTALYSKMKNRVEGEPTQKPFYKGLPICTKEAFYNWALSDDSDFLALFAAWRRRGGDRNRDSRKLVPSINRIDNKGGYEIGNMEFVTNSANSAAGGRNGRGSIKTKWHKDHSPAERENDRKVFLQSRQPFYDGTRQARSLASFPTVKKAV